MGLFGKITAFSAGSIERITCKTCDDTYRSNIDKRFPYAICGGCLEREQKMARNNGDKQLENQIQQEFSRRSNLL